MEDTGLEAAILAALAGWPSLPESDLLRRLSPVQVVRYRLALVERMADAGLVTLHRVGDELVLAATDAGRRAAAEQGAPAPDAG